MQMLEVNGYKVAHHQMVSPNVNIRIIVNAGAADEPKDCHGVAHFLEHMFFKGTTKRDYKSINKDTSRLGSINAYTSRHLTVYYFTVPASKFHAGTEILTEMVFSPAFPEDEFICEKGVILQEFQTAQDNATSFFMSRLYEHLMGFDIGHEILGTADSIQAMRTGHLRDFIGKFYNPSNIIISVCGNVTREETEIALAKLLPTNLAGETNIRPKIELNLAPLIFNHKSKQAMLAVIWDGWSCEKEIDTQFVADIYWNAVGGGMHSLLFDRIREELGLCYSVGGYHHSMKNEGLNFAYTMLEEANIDKAKSEMTQIFNHVAAEGISEELLDIAKSNQLFKIGCGLETCGGVGRQADGYFVLGENQTLDIFTDYNLQKQSIEKITNEDIKAFAKLFSPDQPVCSAQMTEKR